MFTTWINTKVISLAALATLVLVGVANAYPSKGGSCAMCHKESGGQLTVAPDPVNIQLAANGLLTFKVTKLNDDDSVISVQGLDNPLLAATVMSNSSKYNTWTFRSNAKYGQSYVSNTISEKGSYLMKLAIGADATPGIYPITVMFADEDEGCTTLTFNLAVGPQGIPEPATLGLFFLGAATVLFRRKNR